jgi:hypothetical protein
MTIFWPENNCFVNNDFKKFLTFSLLKNILSY